MNKIWMSIITVAVFGLSACGGGSSGGTTAGTTTPTGSGSAPTTTTVSGKTFTIDGVWKSTCYSSAGPGSADLMDTVTLSGATGTVAVSSYTSTNTTCTGTPTSFGGFTLSIASGATEAITGWVLSTGATATAPTAKDGSGPLSTTASFTKQTGTVTAISGASLGVVVGDVFDVSMVVDDTAIPAVGYSINYAVGASTGIADDFMTKQ